MRRIVRWIFENGADAVGMTINVLGLLLLSLAGGKAIADYMGSMWYMPLGVFTLPAVMLAVSLFFIVGLGLGLTLCRGYLRLRAWSFANPDVSLTT